MIQQIRSAISSKLNRSYPEIPILSREDVGSFPDPPYFHTELTLAELEPLSQRRYAARFRFRIHYKPAADQPVASLMDEMMETLTMLEVDGRPCQASSVAWERPEEEGETEREGYFRAEYVLQLTTDQTKEGVKMQTLQQGGQLK